MDVDKLQLLETFLAGLALERKVFGIRDMALRDDSPHPVAYVETGPLTKNTHAGQMKLLLADEMGIMQGLLHICWKSGTNLGALTYRPGGGRPKVAVVVAGAAPGDHFVDLSSTFGFVDFHLYDPCVTWGWYPPLNDRRKPQNVSLYRTYFTVQTAEEWAGKKGYEHVIFLSDLRTGDGMVTEQVEGDMETQRQMTIAIDACYSVLKFRPRYYDDATPPDKKNMKYFDGTICLQGYPPNHSTETRLHVTDARSEKEYDVQVYQDQLFYHNQVTRNPAKVLFGVFGPEALSYDNAHSRFVKKFLLRYLGPLGQGISERDRNRGKIKFGHGEIRALLEDFKCLVTDRV
jgi:Poly A polymerase regulatory subunit